jgi:hypothetical protein
MSSFATKRVIAAAALVALLGSGVALANVAPGPYTPTSDSFDPANAPGSSHLASGSPS